MLGFEENEISAKANGGTEIAKRRLASILDQDSLEHFQIICSRERELKEDKIRIFWCHDMPEDPESSKFRDPSWRNKFHKFVFISNWQYQRYCLIHNLPVDDKAIILESGIDPAPDECLDKTHDKIRLVYTSTPQRGLEILVPVFEYLAKEHEDIHLDVFSSFKIYGWDQSDLSFEPLYNSIRNHPQMTYHGFVSNEKLKQHLNSCNIFAYPSIWYETSCRSMLEAMSAGLVCVHSDIGALPETSGGLNIMYHADLTDKSNHANIFAANLNSAIKFVKSKNETNMIRFNKAFVDSRFDINSIKFKWNLLLKTLIQKYPTPESRKTENPKFVYRTA